VRKVAAPKPGTVRAGWQIDLPPGEHAITVQAESAVSKGMSDILVVDNTSPDPNPPALYILAVGVSDYPGDMKLNYAASDARMITSALQQHSGGAFREVKVKLITDREATGQGIVDGLAWLRKQMTARDVGIVFFSGHGTRDEEGNFYFVPIDIKPRNVRGTCIPGEALKKALGNMPGRLIAIFDACHSGAAAEKRVIGRTDDLTRDLVTEDYGIVCMCSSLGEEYSLESSLVRAGFYTLSLAEGLSGKADANGDRTIHLHELEAYTLRRVRELSENKQNPIMGRPVTFRSFPMARPR
jgi:uncharacterized caspase-like protein